MRITPDCFDELFVLVKEDIAEQTISMKDASAKKLKFATKTFHVHFICSFIFLIFSYVAI